MGISFKMDLWAATVFQHRQGGVGFTIITGAEAAVLAAGITFPQQVDEVVLVALV